MSRISEGFIVRLHTIYTQLMYNCFMNSNELMKILRAVQDGLLSPEDALEKLRDLPFEFAGFSHIDHHREIRQGIPEVVFAEGKSVEEIREIASRIYSKTGRVLITRVSEDVMKYIDIPAAEYYHRARLIIAGTLPEDKGSALIITAGTSDLPVAEEAFHTARFLGIHTEIIGDVGVAGIHRLFAHREKIRDADVIIVVAGMEGALPSVVAGITESVVIGVPTSTGYGTALGGLTPLFAMLNSCVPGLAVMNIDNGFGAACLACRINMLKKQ